MRKLIEFLKQTLQKFAQTNHVAFTTFCILLATGSLMIIAILCKIYLSVYSIIPNWVYITVFSVCVLVLILIYIANKKFNNEQEKE